MADVSERERLQGGIPSQRVVIEYAYHQRGSTKHWERGKVEFRHAFPVEYSTPLGTRLDVNGQKTV